MQKNMLDAGYDVTLPCGTTYSKAASQDHEAQPTATKPAAKTAPAKAKKQKSDKYAPAGFHYLSKVKLREAKIAGLIPWLTTVNEAMEKYGMTTDFAPHTAKAKAGATTVTVAGATEMSKRDSDDLARLKRKGYVVA
jgi:hypothetical protein